jgi:hypothetical protein
VSGTYQAGADDNDLDLFGPLHGVFDGIKGPTRACLDCSSNGTCIIPDLVNRISHDLG